MKNFARNPHIGFIDNNGEHPKPFTIKVSSSYECKKWLEKQIKEDELYAFGYVGITGNKHIITVYKNQFGNIVFYDPQDNSNYEENLLDYVYFGDFNKSPKVFRIDNAKTDQKILEKISEPYK